MPTDPEPRPPPSELTVAELLARAAEYRRMAMNATTNEVMQSLFRLAERYERLARERQRPH